MASAGILGLCVSIVRTPYLMAAPCRACIRSAHDLMATPCFLRFRAFALTLRAGLHSLRQLLAKGISAGGGPINLDRSVPGLGRNFWVRPPVASAIYRFPSGSIEKWCGFQIPPGNVPCVPHEVIIFPLR